MKSQCKAHVIYILWICLGLSIFAQEDEQITTQQTSNSGASLTASTADASPNIMLARSTADYRVTPGDVYTLSYAAGSNSVSYTITVDPSYRIRVSNLGVISGAGKTFMQLKTEVETIVTNNYTLSGVQLVLTQPAVFRINIKGEVHTAGEISVWALRRLSSITGGNLTSYASIRDVSVQSANGQTQVYDLFKAQRLGDLSQDPYLRPGDTVTFNRINRRITINGSVERPGTYQILEGEKLQDLINVYANGLTPLADKTRITLTRYIDSIEISGDITYLTDQDLHNDLGLQHLDVVSVPSITASRPAVHLTRLERRITIDGAVRRPGTYDLMPHENLKELLEVYGDGFTPIADKTRVTLTRYVGSVEISGDIIYLSEHELTQHYALQHLDVITIPDITELRPAVPVNRIERTITIDGAVRRPGIYELMPHENLKELLEVYADGFTPLADKTRTTLTRRVGGSEISGNIILLSEKEFTGNYTLQHLDTITIPDITELRPAVYINRIERMITISGAVRQPGTYEIMPHEHLKELIEVYADGFAPLADPTRMEMIRYVNSENITGDKIFLVEDDINNNYLLEHYDTIYIPSLSQLRPIIFVEGAVARTSQALDDTEATTDSYLDSSTRLIVRFDEGETYTSLIRRNNNWFVAVSDTQNAYISRGNQRIPINLDSILYSASYRDNLVVQENDILIVPFRQYFITVSGAVVNPGRYPYIPEREWDYYIALAGGFIAGRNSAESVTITNINGKKMKKTDSVTPETIITANTNHPLYFFNQYAPVITTILTVITTFLSIQLYASR